MASVRDAAFDLFRAHGMTTIFGNLRVAIAAHDGPRLVQVPVASGMWLE